MTILKRLASEASEKITREVAQKSAHRTGRRVAGTVAKDVANTVAKDAAHTVAKDVAHETGRKAAQTLGRDVIVKSASEGAKKVAGEAANPAFDAALSAVRERLSKEGKFANVSGPLMEALSHAKTSEESLSVVKLARKLALSFNKENRGAVLHGLADAMEKAKVHEEAFATLGQVVKTRQEAFSLFHMDNHNQLIKDAVAKVMKIGGGTTEELATRAIKLAPPRFGQRTAKETIHRVSAMEKIADQVATIAGYLIRALG